MSKNQIEMEIGIAVKDADDAFKILRTAHPDMGDVKLECMKAFLPATLVARALDRLAVAVEENTSMIKRVS
jgi:hypothetical protein